MSDKRWTKEEMDEHIRDNLGEYSAMVVIGFLYKKIYGHFPKIGMSPTQVEFADSVVDVLPEVKP